MSSLQFIIIVYEKNGNLSDPLMNQFLSVIFKHRINFWQPINFNTHLHLLVRNCHFKMISHSKNKLQLYICVVQNLKCTFFYVFCKLPNLESLISLPFNFLFKDFFSNFCTIVHFIWHNFKQVKYIIHV